jgi:hypothetical protein
MQAGVGERTRLAEGGCAQHRAQKSVSCKELRRQHRYPGVRCRDQPITRHAPNHPHGRPASSACPYSQPTYENPHIPVDHARQFARIHRFAAQRQRSAHQFLANQHIARIEQHRSETRPKDPRRDSHGVIRREIERMRAAKGIKPACNLRRS